MKYSKHKQYYNKEGVEVPSATTIISILNKPALVKWANIMGFKRTRTEDILSRAAEIGTLMHDCLEKFFKGEKFSLPEKHFNYKDILLIRLDGFFGWKEKQSNVKAILLEEELVTDTFGGTMDFYGELNSENIILDFKTSSNVYSSMFLQLAAYTIIMEERGYQVDAVGILHITEKGTKLHRKSREELEKYVVAYKALVIMFTTWYDLNIEDGWGNICEK